MLTYLEMLTYKRPHGSASERKFINRYIRPLGVETDAAGNLYKRIGTAPVAWCAHTDSVHKASGRQAIAVDASGYVTALDSDCLGADDASGIWLMMQMIHAKVEGLYIFHRGEEVGGIGSSYIADETPELLAGIDYAIAFDRQDFTDVITEQWGGVCASDTFARSLGHQLGMGYKPSDMGVFTDTANYVRLVPECTNISVGYMGQHRPNECQHLGHLWNLRNALVTIDIKALIVERDHTIIPIRDYQASGSRYEDNYQSDRYGSWLDGYGVSHGFQDNRRSSRASSYDRLLDAIADHPNLVAQILEEYGINADDILETAANGGSIYG